MNSLKAYGYAVKVHGIAHPRYFLKKGQNTVGIYASREEARAAGLAIIAPAVKQNSATRAWEASKIMVAV